MAAFHARSNSFPSRENLFASEIEEQLNRINSSNAASSSSSSEIYHKLNSLVDVHECIEKLLLAQKTFATENNGKDVDELLDGSLRLLDLCSAAKDVLQHTKESVLELQSNLRRKTQGEEKYLSSRKIVKRTIKKALESLKRMQKSNNTPKEASSATFAIIRDTEAATLSVFESLFSLVSAQHTKSNSWSVVSKLVQQKKVSCSEETENEFSKVDLAVTKTGNNLQEKLKDLEMCVEDLEENIDRLNRRLIKTRVSLLNILNH